MPFHPLGCGAFAILALRLSEKDQIAFLHNMQALFLESKEIARKKFTPHKYRLGKTVTSGSDSKDREG